MSTEDPDARFESVHDAAASGAPQGFGNHARATSSPLTFSKTVPVQSQGAKGQGWEKNMLINGEAILENVRRYRAIASLHRQTAAFRPHQSWSLLDQAEHWDHLALAELEAYFAARNTSESQTYH